MLRDLFVGGRTRLHERRWAAASGQGTGRRENQDAWGQRNGTFVVADGMGGRQGGSTAATAAVAASLDTFGNADSLHPLDWASRMASVNDGVMLAGRRAGHDRVGAAITVVRCIPGRVVISHAGDVRIYRLRRGETHLLTRRRRAFRHGTELGRTRVSTRSRRRSARRPRSPRSSPATNSWQRHSLACSIPRRGDRLRDLLRRRPPTPRPQRLGRRAVEHRLPDVGRRTRRPLRRSGQHGRSNRPGDHARVGDVTPSHSVAATRVRIAPGTGTLIRRPTAVLFVDGDDAVLVDAFVSAVDAGRIGRVSSTPSPTR